MFKKLLLVFTLVSALGSLVASPAFSQLATNAEVNGTITDETGAVLPGVTVTIRNVGTGLEIVGATSSLGRYSIAGLPPGEYELRAELEGFATYIQEGLILNIGRVYTMSFAMKLAAIAETITVTGEAPLIETSRSEVGTVIPEQLIDALPLLDRNFFTLAMAVPGSAEQTYFDPTKARAGGLDGVGFGAGSGRENLVLIDGGDNNDDVVGSILQFYPQDSIQEFEVITNRFDAQYGHTIGGVVNVITKSGTNEFSGGGYWLFRDKSLNTLDAVSVEAGLTEKPPFRQNIFGGYLGGPLVKDKVHFFFDYDHTIRPASVTLFYDTPYWDNLYGGSIGTDFHQYLMVGKVTANLGTGNFLMARYAWQDDGQSNYLVGGVNPEHTGGTGGNTYHSLLGKVTSIVGDNSLNEAIFQYSKFLNLIESNSPEAFITLSCPEIDIGYNGNLPQSTLQKKYQFVDNYSYHTTAWGMEHDFKAGFEYQLVRIDGYIGYDYDPGWRDRGYDWSFAWDNTEDMVAYQQGDDSRLPDRASVSAGYGLPPGDDKNHIVQLYFKDDLQVTKKLTLNLGFHYGFEKGQVGEYHDLVQNHFDEWGAVKTDYNNFAPRLGFAYDAKGDGTMVIRGGYGHFYGQVMNNILLWLESVQGLDIPLAISSGTIFNPGYGPRDVEQGTAPDPNTIAPYPSAPEYTEFFGGYTYFMMPNFQVPMVRTASIGASWDLGSGYALDVDFVRSWTRGDYTYFRGLGRSFNKDGELDPAGFDITEYFSSTSRIMGPFGRNDYTGLLVGLRKRFEKNMTMQLSYTFARHKGNVREGLFGQDDDRDFPDFSYNYGYLIGKRDHSFVASLLYLLPYDMQIGTILTTKSGVHYTGFDTRLGDVDGDGYTSDSIDAEGRGGYTTYPYFTLDARFAKLFTIGGKYRAQVFFEVFNLFNRDNRNFADIHQRVDLPATFGKSWMVLGVPRQAQLSLRLDF